MATSYQCDQCGVTIATLYDALVISVSFLHYSPDMPTTGQPTGKSLDETLPDLLFHNVTCRDEWCAQAGITPPAGAKV
jgi:hypothetical protein